MSNEELIAEIESYIGSIEKSHIDFIGNRDKSGLVEILEECKRRIYTYNIVSKAIVGQELKEEADTNNKEFLKNPKDFA